jgi:hypothetical protein
MSDKNFNFIIFSSINWTTHNQLHHELTNYLISKNNKVLFVENTGSRSLKFSDYKRVIHRIKIWFRSTLGVKAKNRNLTIFSPLFIPLPFNYFAIKINNFIISMTIKKWQELIERKETIIITFLPTPLIYNLSLKINKSLLVYYCADEMTHFSSYKKKLVKWENKLIRKSDIVFHTSEKLGKKIKEISHNSFLIENGVDFNKFNSKKRNNSFLKFTKNFNKIIGYVGALRSIVDDELLYQIAKTYPGNSLILIGPVYPDFKVKENYKKLKLLKNVFFIGSVEHSVVPNYTINFDIAIIPYKINDFTNSIYPVKLNEYLSQGLRIIATNIFEISNFKKKYPNLIDKSKDNNDFIRLIENQNVDNFYEEKINHAKNNDWKNKFSYFNTIIQKEHNNFSNKSNLENDFKDFVNNFRRKLIRYSALFLVIFFILFKSPLFWFLGNSLIVRDDLREINTLVAFVGNGENQYNNFSYQKRALDILKYYDPINTKHIILISGRMKEIADVDLLKIFLIAKGIPEFKLIIPNKNPTSTYNAAEIAYDNLINSDKYYSILTAPYHSKRLQLIWKKNFNDKYVFFPEVLNTPNNEIQWGLKLGDMKIIIYEYAAIIYNWFKGRL